MIHGPAPAAAGNVNIAREAHGGIPHIIVMLRRSRRREQSTVALKGPAVVPPPAHPVEGPHHPHNVQQREQVRGGGGVDQAGHHLARRLVQRPDVVGLGGQQGAVEEDDVHPAVSGAGRQARGPVVELEPELGRFRRRRRFVVVVVLGRTVMAIIAAAVHPPPPPPGRRRLGPHPLLGPLVPPDAALDAVLDLVVQPDEAGAGDELRRDAGEHEDVRVVPERCWDRQPQEARHDRGRQVGEGRRGDDDDEVGLGVGEMEEQAQGGGEGQQGASRRQGGRRHDLES
mmetsp:Transcript_27936/g.65582  ORF Transcript_27936/g.65582 Transcript_27936/m.65582 type:complete len:285 (+) Transcript_27936:333-1187(+)